MDPAPLPIYRHTFLSLPLEIRIQVYDLALVRRFEYDIEDIPITLVRVENGIGCEYEPLPPSPALLRSNRQIHIEAAPTLYGSNIFKCSAPRNLEAWLTQIGSANSGSVRHLHLSVTLCVSEEGTTQVYEFLHPHDVKHLSLEIILEIQGASQDWLSLFRKLSSEALGLRTLYVGFLWIFEFTGFGTDPERLVEEIGRLKGLERICMGGMVARKWVDSLREITGAKVLENGRETGA